MREVDVPRRGPGYLDLARADAALRTPRRCGSRTTSRSTKAMSGCRVRRIADTRVSLASDRSFVRTTSRSRICRGRALPNDIDLYWNQQLLDVLLEYSIASERSEFSIHPRLARLGLQVVTVLRFLPPGGAERAFELHGDPGLVRLDPRWHQAVLRFVAIRRSPHPGRYRPPAVHACLVIPFRRCGRCSSS